MNKVTCVKNKDYTTISNLFFRDKNLSLKAKGLLALVLTLPDDWDFTIKGLEKVVKEGKSSIYTAIDELKTYGYCKVETVRNEKGMMAGSDYMFFESPYQENPHAENPYTENPHAENQPQINNNIINGCNEQNKEEIKELKEKFTIFVSLYKKAGGKVRGVDTEFKEFTKRHKDWKNVVPYLEMALQREIKERNQAKIYKKFYPEMKNLSTYLGKQRAWEMYVTVGEKIDDRKYSPQGRSIWFNEGTQSYWSDDNFYYETISDGYDDDNRPDGATLTLNNARGDIRWNSTTKKWEKKITKLTKD